LRKINPRCCISLEKFSNVPCLIFEFSINTGQAFYRWLTGFSLLT
jgi:hypothetical protein